MWPFKKKSVSGSTIYEYSVVRLIKETTLEYDSSPLANHPLNYSAVERYSVQIVGVYSDKTETIKERFVRLDDIKDAEYIYNYLVDHNGCSSLKETISEQKIEKK